MCQTSRFAPVPGQDDGSAAWVWGCQRNDAWTEAWFLSWATLSWDFRRLTRWFSAQVSHLVRFGIAGFGQPLDSSRDLASPALPGRRGVVVPSAPASGASSGRILGVPASWFRLPLGLVRDGPSVSVPLEWPSWGAF